MLLDVATRREAPMTKTVTRNQILDAAADLIAERGAATSLANVSTLTGATSAQLYRYFGDDRGLVKAAVEHRCSTVLGVQAHALHSVDGWEDLERWAELIIEEHGARGGCPIGTLAAVLPDTDTEMRASLSATFRVWRAAIRGALLRLRANGLISADADLDSLATITLSAIQGGLLLAKTFRDPEHLRRALAGAIAELRAHAPGPS
jgi:AcrR family transcriptional regulator